MRIHNVDEMIYAEQQRRMGSGNFGYGDFGSAVADLIIDSKQDTSITDDILQAAKVKYREFVTSLQQTIRDRNDAIDWINSLVPGADRDSLIARFKAQDAVFFEAYNPLRELISQIAPETGDTFPEAKNANFGWFAIPLAVFRVVIPFIPRIITALTVFFSVREGFNVLTEDSKLKYQTMKENPELAKILPPPPSSSLFSEIGSGAKMGIILLAGTAALVIAMNMFRSRSA